MFTHSGVPDQAAGYFFELPSILEGAVLYPRTRAVQLGSVFDFSAGALRIPPIISLSHTTLPPLPGACAAVYISRKGGGRLG